MENDFDKQLRDALYDYEASYDSADWDDLEARLDEAPERKGLAFWLKALEALLLLLFLVYGYSLLTGKASTEEPPKPVANRSTEQLAELKEAEETATKSLATAEKLSTKVSNEAPQQASAYAPDGMYSGPSAESSTAVPQQEPAGANTLPPSEVEPKAGAASEAPEQTIMGAMPPVEETEAEEVPVSEQAPAAQEKPVSTIDPERKWLSARLVLPLYPERLTGELIDEHPRRIKMRKPFQPQWRYGFLLSTDANNNSPYGRGRMGESFGFNLHLLFNERIAFESGVGLAFKRFDYNGPLRQYSDDGSLVLNEDVRELRNTQLRVLYIPLNVQYEVYENKKWRGYVTAGGMLQTVLEQRHSGTLRQTLAQSNGQVQTTAQINPIGAERGWAQGGTWQESYFLSWSLGLGLERQVSDQWHLFIQPNYQRAFTAYGQRSSFLTAFSLNMGIRSTFNKEK